MVLLVTGKCGTGCYYCPLSRRKKGRDAVYANERRVANDDDIVEEARLIDAEGTGITGGDPLSSLDRTLDAIALLKTTFGQKHHIHLYTSTIDPAAFDRLESAGLDELRIHPRLGLWKKMGGTDLKSAVEGTGMRVGIEVPAIPGRRGELVALIRYVDKIGLDFVNVNELEFSETNWRRLRNRGFDTKGDVSSAVAGSQELAVDLIGLDVSIPIHYCSSSFKDGIQLRRRIKRRAKNVAREGDVITEDGTLLKGVVEGRNLSHITHRLTSEFDVPDKLVHIDFEKRRVEVAPWILKELAAELPYDSYIVEEYPTADRLEVEREQLGRRTKRR